MAQLVLDLPQDLLDRVQEEARRRKVPLQDLIVASLEGQLSGRGEPVAEAGRLARFVRESGLFAPPDRKLGPELAAVARTATPEERERLATALSRGKSLSEMIIEDRG